MKTKQILTTLILFTMLSCASAAVYYVDNSSGNDSYSGTSAQPWKTLSKAASAASGGDTVYVRNGNYAGFSDDKARSNWLSFVAETGNAPQIDSLDLGTSNSSKDLYLSFDGFKISGGIYIGKNNYVKILNCNIQTQPANVSGYYAPYYSVTAIDMPNGATYVTIQGNEISGAYRGIGAIVSNNCTIKNNTIHHLGEDGISATGSSNLLVEGNRIYDLGPFRTVMELRGTPSGSFTPGETVRIQDVQSVTGVYTKDSSGGIYVYPTSEVTFHDYRNDNKTAIGLTSGKTITVTDTDPPHCDCFQISSGTGMTGIVLRGNIFDRVRADGIGSQNGQGMKIHADAVNGAYVVIENNVIAAEMVAADTMGINAVINNNTFIGGGQENYPWFEIVTTSYPSTITELYNNVIEAFNPNGATIASHGNNIFNHSGALVPNGTETELDNSTAFRALFSNYAANPPVLTLATGSRAINYGNSSYGPATDILGNSRVGATDAGAYEFGGSSQSCAGTDSNCGSYPSCSACGSGKKCCSNSCTTPTCTATSGCSSGQTCSNPGTCNASCTNIQCSDGAITSACYCGGSVRTSGYCCSNAYQAIACGSCVAGTTQSCTTGLQGICSAGTKTCQANGTWPTACTQTSQSTTENCSDSLDNDCDGSVDCGDSDCYTNPSCVVAGIPSGYVSFWKFDGTANDEAGRANGTLAGNASYVPGKYGQALNLDGSGDYVSVDGVSSAIATGPFSVAAWIKFPSNYANGSVRELVFRLGDSPSNNDAQFGFGRISPSVVDGKLYLDSFDGTNMVYASSSQNSWTANNWYLVAGTCDGAVAKVYVNGQLAGQSSSFSRGTTPYSTHSTVGASYNDIGSVYFNGQIDNLVIYNRALSAAEILQMYNPTSTACDTETLMNYILQWKTGNITISTLMQKIGAWKAAQPC